MNLLEEVRTYIAKILLPKTKAKTTAEFREYLKKGFVITRNVDIILHKPVTDPNWKSWMPVPKELIVDSRHVHNDVVDAGEVLIAELLAHKFANNEATLTIPHLDGLQYITVGTGVVAVSQNDVNLGTPGTGSNVSKAATTTFVGTSGDNEFKISTTYDTGDANGAGTLAITEAGIFVDDSIVDAPTTEDDITNRMFNRAVFAVLSKTSGFQLTIQWLIKIGTLT